MKEHLRAILGSYRGIFFLQTEVIGVAILAITLVNPHMGLAGVIGAAAAYAFACVIGMRAEFMASGQYTYNPLLVGLSIGYVFPLTPITIFFVVSAGILALMATILMAHVFHTYFRLPVLSLPFVLISSIAYLASLHYSNLQAATPTVSGLLTTDLHLPFWLAGYFRAFGAILLAPYVVVGVVFALLVLRYSRILILLSLFGYYTGATVRALMLGSAPQAFGDFHNFNFILVAMIVGGVYLVPSVRSYSLAVITVVISTLVLDAVTVFWLFHGIPAFALPFNVVSMATIYVLGLTRYPMLATRIGPTPEDTLENYLADRLRYRGEQRTLYLPFSGKWTVWQGFDGEWTHKGGWQYAYDFVITDEECRRHRNGGQELTDYYCYRKPVLSPVRGRVVKVIEHLPDNPVGSVDEANNWGNLVLLEDPRGFYVELSHLAANSVEVKEGDWVERGAVLGLCGNSGFSPQPHIHVQVQASDEIGAGTLPFSFVSYSDGSHLHANDLPEAQQPVEPLYTDKRLDGITTFLLDDILEYDILRDGKMIDHLTLKVKIALDGTLYFESKRGRLYFGKHEGTFYFYRVDGSDRWLTQLFLALPRLPLAHRDKLTWQDYAPVGLAASGLHRVVARFLCSFYAGIAEVRTTQRFLSQNRVETVIESSALKVRQRAEVELDPNKGFASIKIDGIEMRRTNGE